jgi:hypothetical protein
METPHEYEEREAEEERRDGRQRQIDKVVPPPRATTRTTDEQSIDEILAEARESCSDMDDEESTVTCMLGYLARQIQIIERNAWN